MSFANIFETSYNNHKYEYKYVEQFNVAYPVATYWAKDCKFKAEFEHAAPLYFPNALDAKRPAETSAQRSVRRAKKILRDLCFANFDDECRFLTLTYGKDGCHDRRQFQDDIKACMRRLRAVEEVKIRYLGVFEEHKSGHGLHAHLILNCSFYRNEDFQNWFWRKGFVKLEKLKREEGQDALVNISQYLLKYLTKDVENEEKNIPRYFCSRNLKRWKEVKCYEVEDEIFEVFVNHWIWDGWEKVYEYEFTNEEWDFKKRTLIFRKKLPFADENFFEHSAQKIIDFLDQNIVH